MVSLSNKFVVWLAYGGRKLRLFIVLLPIIALTVDNYGLPYPPIQGDPRATNYPIFVLRWVGDALRYFSKVFSKG